MMLSMAAVDDCNIYGNIGGSIGDKAITTILISIRILCLSLSTCSEVVVMLSLIVMMMFIL